MSFKEAALNNHPNACNTCTTPLPWFWGRR